MFFKKQIPSVCELYSLYEEMPEEFLDETYFGELNFQEHR